MKKLALFIPALLLFAGCTTSPKVDIAAEEAALRDLLKQEEAAYQQRDIDKLLSLNSPGLVVLAPAELPLTSPEKIRQKTEQSLADTSNIWQTYTNTISAVEVSLTGDLAYIWGTDQLDTKTPAGIIPDPAKWVEIWKKTDGQWKQVIYIWTR